LKRVPQPNTPGKSRKYGVAGPVELCSSWRKQWNFNVAHQQDSAAWHKSVSPPVISFATRHRFLPFTLLRHSANISSVKARSAAQNEPVIQVCSQCGAVSNQDVEVCPFCESPFSAQPAPVAALAPSSSSGEPEWRQEVARRLEVYRSRRPHAEGEAARAQSPLPFIAERPAIITTATAPRTLARLRPTQHVEIHVSQPQLDFSVVENFRVQPAAPSVPAAELSARRFAGILDAAAVSAVFLLFFAMFRSLGGQLAFAKADIGVYALVFFLIYALYFSLFTLFSGATPGMTARGLSVVALDGNFPENSQLLWRTFGYFLSGGTLLLGFLWALWDEGHFTWHDRISRTYITSAPPDDDPSADSRNTRTAELE
jgi:uncharacterized RDD family membrane protein YckC